MKKIHKIAIAGGALVGIWLVYEYTQAKARQEALENFVISTITKQQEAQANRRKAFDDDFKRAWSGFDRKSRKEQAVR